MMNSVPDVKVNLDRSCVGAAYKILKSAKSSDKKRRTAACHNKLAEAKLNSQLLSHCFSCVMVLLIHLERAVEVLHVQVHVQVALTDCGLLPLRGSHLPGGVPLVRDFPHSLPLLRYLNNNHII